MSLITHITQAPQITLVGGTAPQIVTLVGVPGLPGPAGAHGAGLAVAGAVDSAALLPAAASAGDTWVTRDDGHGHTWNGAAWVGIGPIAIQGPAGAAGKDGQIRYTGHGAPGVILGAEPGDTYLNLLTGEIYKLT